MSNEAPKKPIAAKKTRAKKATSKKAAPKKASPKKTGAKKPLPSKAASASARVPSANTSDQKAHSATSQASKSQAGKSQASKSQAGKSQAGAIDYTDPKRPSTRHFPIQMFASVLGVAGLGLAWREVAETFGFTAAIGTLILGFSAGFYGAVIGLYAVKSYRHPDAFLSDVKDPVRSCYFSAAGMGLLLLSSAALPHSTGLAEILWLFGMPLNLVITIMIIGGWMHREVRPTQVMPVWFLPIAGNLLAAIAAPSLGYAEAGWMIFAIGLVFWLVLQVILFYRLLVEAPIERTVRPTIVIMLAPPALATIAYQVLSDGAVFGPSGGFGTMLYGLTLFVATLLALQIPMLIRMPFGLSAWAYSFPLSAFTVAATLYAARTDHWLASTMASIGLLAASLITVAIFVKTARALLNGDLFRPNAMQIGQGQTD